MFDWDTSFFLSVFRRERPVINTKTVDLNYLKTLPNGTLGKEYSNFLTKYVRIKRIGVRFTWEICSYFERI